MRCRTCGNEAVKNQANWKEFYYCRTCKIEIVESSVKQDIEDLYNIIVRQKKPYDLETDKAITLITKKLFFGEDGKSGPMELPKEDDDKLEEILRTMGNTVLDQSDWEDWGLRYLKESQDKNVPKIIKKYAIKAFVDGVYVKYQQKHAKALNN